MGGGRRIFPGLLILLAHLAISMAADPVPDDRIDAAVRHAEEWHAAQDCPGLSVAITDGAGTEAARGFGQRSLEPDQPATAETRYAVGSVTKPVTAAATLVLASRDRIDIHDPIGAYLPVFEDVPGEPITIHELLSHTSGMPDDELTTVGDDIDGWSEFLAFLDGTADRRRLDGDRWLYYSSGYCLLARLVEVVSGKAFPSFVEDELFEPLGMERSTFDTALLGTSADVMTPYSTADGDVRTADVTDNPVLSNPVLQGTGGLLASVTDLATFLCAWLAEDTGLPDVPVGRMTEPVGVRDRLVDGSEYAYGYGCEIGPFGGDTLVGHRGNTGASAAFAGGLADRGVGVAFAYNANPSEDPEALARELLAILTGRDPAAVDPVRSIEREMDDLAGRYVSAGDTHRATVRRDGARLEVAFGGDLVSMKLRLLPLDVRTDYAAFTDVDSPASTTDVEFFGGGETVEFLFESVVLERVEDLDGTDA